MKTNSRNEKYMKNELYRKMRELNKKYDNVMAYFTDAPVKIDGYQFEKHIEITSKKDLMNKKILGATLNPHTKEVTFWKDANTRAEKSIGWIVRNFSKQAGEPVDPEELRKELLEQ